VVQPAASSARFTPDELNELLNTAIARHGEAERAQEARASMATMDDALEIARSLGIPEEHVREAAAEMRRKQGAPRPAELARLRRMTWMAGGTVLVSALLLTFAVAPSVPVVYPVGAGLLLMVTFAAWAIMAARLGQARMAATLPAVGVCRVCGEPAYNERATFCEAHRYKAPGA
jgi:hypothetical protein